MDIELLKLYRRIVGIWESAASDLDKIYDNHFWVEAEVEETVIEARDREISAIDEQIKKIHLEKEKEKHSTYYDEVIQAKKEKLELYCESRKNCKECMFNEDCHYWGWCANNKNAIEIDYEKYIAKEC